MRIRDNIWKFGVYSFIDHIRLIWMISTLYLLWLGFSFTNIGIHETIFAIVIVLLELPTGALADIIGRKKAVIISCLLNGAGFVAIGLMTLPMHYYMIALVMGIAFSFISGADIALLYDSVKRLGKRKHYKKIRGKINTYNTIASVIGVFLGPYLFTINPRLGFIVTGAIYIAAAVVVSTMVEPYTWHKRLNLRTHWRQTVNGLKYTLKHKQIMWLIGFFFFTTIGIEFFFDFWQQPLLVAAGLDVKFFGIFFAGMLGVRGLLSWYTHRIEHRLKEKASLAFILGSHVILYIIFSVAGFYALVISFAIFYGVLAFQDIVFEDYFNSHIESRTRATVLSVKSLVYNLIGAGLYVTVGKLIDLYSINAVLIGAAVVVMIGGLVLFSLKKFKVNAEICD
ncbi:MFS transporter [Candidatus Woesearchaeota archaeon]|nr:MFS transporter [Candidatus Woesearchaeota archaeon]MBW3021964.1 MFS transporter [Candidatus Woesearchaeota archaeon]